MTSVRRVPQRHVIDVRRITINVVESEKNKIIKFLEEIGMLSNGREGGEGRNHAVLEATPYNAPAAANKYLVVTLGVLKVC